MWYYIKTQVKGSNEFNRCNFRLMRDLSFFHLFQVNVFDISKYKENKSDIEMCF